MNKLSENQIQKIVLTFIHVKMEAKIIIDEKLLIQSITKHINENYNDIKRREYHYQVVFTIIREVCSFHYYINDYTYEEILEAMRLK